MARGLMLERAIFLGEACRKAERERRRWKMQLGAAPRPVLLTRRGSLFQREPQRV
jgi:hypothetical protein